MKHLSLILIILISSSLRSEMINLECKTQSQNSERINKTTLEIEYAKYMELVEPILCVKL